MDAVPDAHHEAGPLSTGPISESERANALRYQPGQATGHVESHFIKANAPDGSRAVWLKHTVLAPPARPEAALAEVWAIAFWRSGQNGQRKGRQRALKASAPFQEARVQAAPFRVEALGCTFTHGRAQGALRDDDGDIRWELTYPCPAQPYKLFPLERMYTGGFPRSKTLTPVPSTRADGYVEVDGERWELSQWPAMQGHNWGQSHAHAYAWVHCNAWRGEDARELWLEALSGRVKAGLVTTPWLSVAALHIDGRTLRFAGPRAMLSRRVTLDHRRYQVTLRRPGATLEASFETTADQMAGLRYQDPDGGLLRCLNSKLARGRFTLREPGRTRSFQSEQVALEIGTREEDHEVALIA